MYLARIGRPDILWSVNKLARAITKWSTFDRIHSSHIWTQTILSCGKHGTTVQIRTVSRFWFCRGPWRFAVNIRWGSVHSGATRSFPKVGCSRNKRQFHTVRRKLNNIFLDAGLRMDGITALDLWDLVIEVFHSSPNQTKKKNEDFVQGSLLHPKPNMCTPKANRRCNPTWQVCSNYIDHVLSNTRHSRFGAMFVCFWG